MNLKIVGRPISRVDGSDKVSGNTVYTADVQLPGMLWGKCLRSPYAHARILSINTEAAKKVKGVRAVITGEDLPGVFDAGQAMTPGVPLVHEDLATYAGFKAPGDEIPNVFAMQKWIEGDISTGFDEADLVVEHTFRTAVAHQAYIEPHSVIVAVDSSDHVDIWASCKAPFRVKSHLSRQLEIPKEQIRVHVVAVGGDFGGKGAFMDIPICYQLAKATRRPVKMIMTYAEELVAGDPRHSSVIKIKSGVKKDGTLTARETEVIFNSGAYASFKPGDPPNPGGATFTNGVYQIPNYSIRSYGVYTNSVPCGYYRAPGQPQAVFAAESHMDLIAKALHIDPLQLRLKNLMRDGEKLAGGRAVDKVRVRETLQAAAQKAGWGKKMGNNTGLGIGVSFRDVGGSGKASAELSLLPAGTLKIVTPVPDIGTGTHTLLRQIAAEVLTVSPELIFTEIGDTESFESDAAPGGSKITNMSGHVVLQAAQQLRQRLIPVAASLLGCTESEVVLRNGRFSRARQEKPSIGFREVARDATQ